MAIKDKYKSRSTGLFLFLTIYAVKYAILNFNTRYFFISTRKKVAPFYEDIFNFKIIGKPKKYETVNKVIGIPMLMDYRESYELGKKYYKGKKFHKNLFEIFTTFPFEHLCEIKPRIHGLLLYTEDSEKLEINGKYSLIINLNFILEFSVIRSQGNYHGVKIIQNTKNHDKWIELIAAYETMLPQKEEKLAA